MKKIKKSLVVAFLLTMVGALLIGGATMAWFTSEAENNDNSFVSGTLEIGLDKSNGQKYFDISNIKPGDKGSSELTVSNTGSLELRYTFSLTKEGGLFEGKNPLSIVIKDQSGTVVDPSASRHLNAGEHETFTFYWAMPTEADNSYQGQSGTLGIGVYAEQVSVE
jgi:predicted ribosomally synthesized peptide with SipW-like signal peptide